MTLRLLCLISCIVAIILFVIGAVATGGPNLKDLAFGLVAFAAGLGFSALEGVSINPRP